MKYERFLDELRMAVAKNRPEARINHEIRQRLKPKMMHAAHQGKSYIEFAVDAPETLNPTGAWVRNHWPEIKAYFDKEGLTCQAVDSNTFVISWE